MGNFIKTIELADATLDFYEAYVISTIKEDVLFEDYHVEQILRIADEVYEHSPYVYISNRKENYNVNPTIYFQLKKQDCLKGIAIISYKTEGLKNAHFEKQFSPLDFEIFDNLEEAKAWSYRVLKEKKAGL